ncbi:TA system VapC family ribonuclease toxin [Rhizobium acaciae]|uniref:TA system VapC family ribonuclease toxin n=1 Tax=Rhizobium acaciae TaxID=2989736 RepID=UPI0003613074
MTFLLDVNVLIALFDPDHLYHEPAHRWFRSLDRDSWATCPLTENGVARILGNPNYPDSPGSPAEVLSFLADFAKLTNHVFWPDDISLVTSDLIDRTASFSPKQLSDIYLLALAKAHGGKLATFDRRIATAPVTDGAETLYLIEI